MGSAKKIKTQRRVEIDDGEIELGPVLSRRDGRHIKMLATAIHREDGQIEIVDQSTVPIEHQVFDAREVQEIVDHCRVFPGKMALSAIRDTIAGE